MRGRGRGAAGRRPLVFRSSAARELTEAFDWYEAQRPGLGHEFLRAAEAAFAAIQRAPALYAVVRGRTRRALLRRFPYGVFYAERADEVVVLAIVHSHADPLASQLWR